MTNGFAHCFPKYDSHLLPVSQSFTLPYNASGTPSLAVLGSRLPKQPALEFDDLDVLPQANNNNNNKNLIHNGELVQNYTMSSGVHDYIPSSLGRLFDDKEIQIIVKVSIGNLLHCYLLWNKEIGMCFLL